MKPSVGSKPSERQERPVVDCLLATHSSFTSRLAPRGCECDGAESRPEQEPIPLSLRSLESRLGSRQQNLAGVSFRSPGLSAPASALLGICPEPPMYRRRGWPPGGLEATQKGRGPQPTAGASPHQPRRSCSPLQPRV